MSETVHAPPPVKQPNLTRQFPLTDMPTGIEEAAIWEWGFLERVSSGLYCLDLGIEELGRPFLQTAEMLI